MKNRNLSITIAILVATTLFATSVAAEASKTTWVNLLHDLLSRAPQPANLPLFPCQEGEEVAILASGISRAEVDDVSVVGVDAIEKGSKLAITCRSVGTTRMAVLRKGTKHPVVVRVGEAIEPPDDLDVEHCGAIANTEARVVVDRRGTIDAISIGGLADEAQKECLRAALEEVKWHRTETSSSRTGVAKIVW